MLESHPPRRPGTTVGYALVAALVLLDVGLIYLIVGEPVTLLTFLWGVALLLSLPALATIAYWTAALGNARYAVERHALHVEWGYVRYVVPLDKIRASYYSAQGSSPVQQFRGLRWPGFQFGQARRRLADDQTQAVHLLTAGSQVDGLWVETEDGAFAITPHDAETFYQCLQALAATGSTPEVLPVPGEATLTSGAPFWRDRPAQVLLGGGLLLCIVLFAVLAATYQQLPGRLALPAGTGTPGQLFVLPVVGTLAWGINALVGYVFYQWRQEPPLAYLLWGAGMLIPTVAWAATLVTLL